MIKNVDFFAVPVKDMARATQFYKDTLGLKQTMAHEDKWAEFGVNGSTISLWCPEGWGMPFQARGGVALGVEDVPKAMAELKAKGIQFHGDMMDSSVCHMGFFDDSEGNSLILHHRYAPEN